MGEAVSNLTEFILIGYETFRSDVKHILPEDLEKASENRLLDSFVRGN